jgi:hypothetical protein
MSLSIAIIKLPRDTVDLANEKVWTKLSTPFHCSIIGIKHKEPGPSFEGLPWLRVLPVAAVKPLLSICTGQSAYGRGLHVSVYQWLAANVNVSKQQNNTLLIVQKWKTTRYHV